MRRRRRRSVGQRGDGRSAVINLTGILFEARPELRDDVQAEGAANIAKAPRQAAGAHALVHVSAIGADAESDSAYAVTKAEGERRCARNSQRRDPASVLIFGPEDGFFNRSPRWRASSRPAADRRRPYPLPAGVCRRRGRRRSWRWSPGGRQSTYELGGPTVYSFKELMQLILRETGRKPLLVPLPFALASLKAMFLQLLPKPLLTRIR
jgi:uncharacterized protein YbjT (DUF2867 family)